MCVSAVHKLVQEVQQPECTLGALVRPSSVVNKQQIGGPMHLHAAYLPTHTHAQHSAHQAQSTCAVRAHTHTRQARTQHCALSAHGTRAPAAAWRA